MNPYRPRALWPLFPEGCLTKKSREAWQRLYSKHGMQYGGSGDLGALEQLLRPGMLVLDAGCGDGKSTEALARKAEVVGCDFSREGLVSLQRQRGKDIDANLVECDLASLPFADEKFDAVACVHSLSHLKEGDRKAASAELCRSLSKGGTVLVEGFGREDFRYGRGQEIERGSYLRGNGIMTHYFEAGEVQRLFEGFETISESNLSRRVSFGAGFGKRHIIRVLLRKL